MRDIVDAFGDLVLGARCPGCGTPALGLCRRCADVLGALRPRPAIRALPGFPPTVAAGEYEAELRAVVLAVKERGALLQLPLLGRLLARAVAALVADSDAVLPITLVPVPSVHSRVVERGLDLTAALAAGAGRELAALGLEIGLRRAVGLTRDPLDQAGLGRSARVSNSAHAYRWRALARGSVVVVDDVVTTGATLAAVATALRRGGTSVLGAATVAETTRRGNPSVPAPRDR